LKRIRQPSQKLVAFAATFGFGPRVTKANPIVLHGKAQLMMIERLQANTNAAASAIRKGMLDGVCD
jgi:hypothetical protein